MKILHTSDWHIGKRLGRHDRMGEFAEVLAEVEAIADQRAVDLVLVSGDIWDRPMPPTDALHLGRQTLLRLARGRPVVAVAGNHDSPGLFEALEGKVLQLPGAADNLPGKVGTPGVGHEIA